jgi:TRAP transporter 4TM/12TM fusion protein
VSDPNVAVSEAGNAPASPRSVSLAVDILQGAMVLCVVLWVIDIPRRLFGLAFYTEQLLAVCLGLSLALTFISHKDRQPNIYEWLAAAASLLICGYITVRYEPLTYELAMLPIDGVIGSALLILLVLEATRRGIGGVLVGIILVLGAYVFIGPYMPRDFATRSVSVERLIAYLGLDVNAMIGPLLGVAVLIVVPFTIMGQVLARTGGAHFFADLAMSAMGKFRGGAAKISVLGSALFGIISGAAVSNVVAVGSVSSPLMKRSGFSGVRAGAIEAVGSTGGQLMPPVMGAAAFIMAEFLQVSYVTVCVAAILPSLLYYAALFMHVDLEAAKHNIGAAQAADVPTVGEVFRSGWHFIVPIAFLIATLIWPQHFQIPIERAAIYSTIMLIVLSSIFGYRGQRVGARAMVRAILESGRASLDIVLIGAAAGMVVGILSISGISFGLTLQLIALSGENLFVLLLLTALVSIILGMGMPTVSVYVLTATLLAPSLVKLGVTPMAAHMYVMYFGMLSMITPPVAIASYAAASIARESGWTTSCVSVMIGWSTFFIPFVFVMEPALLMDGSPANILWQFTRCIIGIFVGTAGIVGYAFTPLSVPIRCVLVATAVAILVPPNAFPGADAIDWVGLAVAASFIGFNFIRSRAARRAVAQ